MKGLGICLGLCTTWLCVCLLHLWTSLICDATRWTGIPIATNLSKVSHFAARHIHLVVDWTLSTAPLVHGISTSLTDGSCHLLLLGFVNSSDTCDATNICVIYECPSGVSLLLPGFGIW